ncbi:MAG: CHAT domain-containing protein, partial [Saprospiraceae bacterium]|nr:CHAT domain-containing protein [Saprospiraceae bacterium]
WEEAGESFESALQSIRLDGIDRLDEGAFPWSPNTLLLLNHYTDFLYQQYQENKDANVLQQFEEYAQLYLNVSEKFRKQFTDPYTKSILIKDNAKVYQRNIGVYQQLYRETKAPRYLAAVYQFSEHGRTCLLRDIQDDKILHYQGVPDLILQKEIELKDQVAALSEQVLEYPDSQQLQQTLFRNEQALDAYLDTLQEQYPHYYRLKFNKQIPDLREVQAQLSLDQNLIEFMQDDTAYYALVVTAKKSQLHHLGLNSTIDKKVDAWKKAITTRDLKATEELGDQLYQLLWAPIRSDLSGNRVNLIPSGRLFYLNFEALKPKGKEQVYLIFDYHISYALSINVLFNDSSPAHQGPIVFVAPGFEADIKQNYQEQLDTLTAVDEAYMKTIRQPWSLKLAKQLKKQRGFQIYQGIEAKESNVVRQLPAANVLYFSTHAIANALDPLRSKLILAKELGAQIEDGYLHAYELFGLSLNADLAILSACESGIGNLQAGEGMISLAYSLQFAGCQSTALSLWKVDEKINTQITAAFVENLRKGHHKSEALRLAKLSFLQNQAEELLHPFYWGGMIHMGQDGVIHPAARFGKWWLWALGVAGLLLLLFFRVSLNRKALNLR